MASSNGSAARPEKAHAHWFIRKAWVAVVEAYANGEMDFESAVKTISRCARACDKDPRLYIGVVADMASRVTAKPLRRRRPEFPRWVKDLGILYVRLLQARNPDTRLAPDEHTEWTSPILEAALDQMVRDGVFDPARPISQHTLYRWYCAADKERGHPTPFSTSA